MALDAVFELFFKGSPRNFIGGVAAPIKGNQKEVVIFIGLAQQITEGVVSRARQIDVTTWMSAL